jgi:hypothetical protein
VRSGYDPEDFEEFLMKKVTLSLGILAVYASIAFADQRVDVNIPGGGAQDLLNMTTVPSEISDGAHDSSVTRSCTTPHGRVVREDENGYNDCMKGKKTPPSPAP